MYVIYNVIQPVSLSIHLELGIVESFKLGTPNVHLR